MTQWVVNRGDSQFSVDGLAELARLAKQGDIDAGDLIQPVGADDWLYAIEIPEIAGVVRKSDDDDDDIPVRRGGAGAAVKGVLYAVFGVVLIAGIGGMVHFYGQLPSGDQYLLGEGGSLRYTELIVLTDAQLYEAPDEKSRVLLVIPKDKQAELLAKRAAFYKARYDGKEGWVRVDDTLAVYQMGDEKVKRKLDPFFNPDQYTKVTSASFTQIEDDKVESKIGTFRFNLENNSDYKVGDLRLLATIKNSKGAEVASKEFSIEGFIPAKGGTMVGTLPPLEDEVKQAEKAGTEPPPVRLMTYAFFEEGVKGMAEEEQEEMYLRFKDGIDIEVDETFTEAEVRIVELRAIPE
jgi:hypothetical protein